MGKIFGSPKLRYAIALATVLAAILLRLALDPLLMGRSPYIFFALAILISARYGGRGPGFAATGISALAVISVFSFPRFSLGFSTSSDVVQFIFLLATGLTISFLGGQLREALEEARIDKARFEAISNTVPQMIWTASPDGKIDYMNARCYEYGGDQLSGPIATAWMSLVHPEDLAETVEYWNGLVASGQDGMKEFRMRRHDGAYRWFETRAIALRNGNGRVMKWFGGISDIQEARELQEALRREAERFNQLVASAPGVIYKFVLRPDGSMAVPYAGPGLKELFHLEPEELAKDLTRIGTGMYPEDRWSIHESIRESARTMSIWQMEYRYRHPVKGEIWIAGRSSPVKEADGLIGWYGFLFDVTEKKRADEALKHRREQELRVLRSLVERAPTGIAMLDRRVRVVQASERWLEDMGLRRDEVIGANLYDARPNIPAQWKQNHAKGLEGETLRGQEEKYVGADGRERWVNWQISPWGDLGEKTGGIIVYTEYVTEFKELQEIATRRETEIRELNAGLERRVRERTGQLEAANRELESFSYSVSHDLRAPLRGINGWSLALLEEYGEQLDERGKEYLERVRAEAKRMGLLIDDLLDLAKVSRSEIRKTHVDLSAMAGGIAANLTELNTGRAIHFSIQDGLAAYGDARLLEIVLRNLLENAVKFTAPKADAEIAFRAVEAEGGMVYSVRDNGVGFEQLYAGNLFRAFQRLHKASEFAGTGIGLATVKRVIHRHGGEVWAEGRLNEGASFCFTVGSNG